MSHQDEVPDEEHRFTPQEVDQLTHRAAELLDQLRDVLGEMTERLEALSEGDK